VCVCVCVCVFVCVCVCVYVCMYVCMYVYIYMITTSSFTTVFLLQDVCDFMLREQVVLGCCAQATAPLKD
jgi:hypothetical protein